MKLTYQTDIILIIALVLAVLWFVNGIVDIVRNSPYTDFELMYRAGEALNDGRLPYDLSMIHATPTLGNEYRFPPFFASLLAFFTPYEFEKVALGWFLLNQVFYFGTLALLYKILGIKFCSVEFYILAIIFLVFQPTLDSLAGGQLDCFFLLLLSLTWWALESRRDKFAGAVNALATIIKIYPGIIILFFLLRRRWKALKFYIITLIALIVLSIILAGWNANYKFFFDVLPAIKGGTAYIENQSLYGFLSRLYINDAFQISNSIAVEVIDRLTSSHIKLLSYLVDILIFVATIFFAYRTSQDRIVFANLITMTLLILPVAWIHYETILLFPITVLFCQQCTKKHDFTGWAGLFIIYALIAFGNQDIVRSSSLEALRSYKVIGVFLLWLFGIKGMIENSNASYNLSYVKIVAVALIFISLISIPPIMLRPFRVEDGQYFILHFHTAEKITINDDYSHLDLFNLNNDPRPVLFEHPPSQITYKLKIPEGSLLTFGIGLDSKTWGADNGDGVLFEIYVQDGGVQERLFSKYIDPKNKIEDRKRHDEVVDLSRYGKKEVSLSFVTTPGPNNNTDYDWAGWGEPKLISNTK